MQRIKGEIKYWNKKSLVRGFLRIQVYYFFIIDLITFFQIVFSTSNEPKILKTVIKTLPEHLTVKRSVGKDESKSKNNSVIIETQEK